MKNLKQYVPDIVAVVLFALISFAYFFPADIEGRILFQHDTVAGAGAGQEAQQYRQETGKTTRWTNSLFGGMPTYQISPSYASGKPLRWVQRIYQLFLPNYVCLVFMMMLGFYILLRAFGCSAWLSALGGICWAFSSYFFIIIGAGHIWKFVTLAYIPPTIAGMVLAYRGRYLLGGLLFALFLALQIFSNHLQMTYYFLSVMLFLVIAFFAVAIRKGELAQFFKASAVLVVAGLLGVAVNLSNLYHTYSYSKETMRGKSELVKPDAGQQGGDGLERDYITQWSYGIGESASLLVPNIKGGVSAPLSNNERAMQKANPAYSGLYTQLTQYFGTQPYTAGPVYVGAFVLFLFILGCFVVKGPVKWALLAATLLSLLLSWGKNFMPLTDFFIDYVPFYNKFRAVSSILVVAEFTIPLLAIFALKEILTRPEVLKEHRNGLIFSVLATAGIALLMFVAPGMFTDFVPKQEAQVLQDAAAQGMIPAAELAGILSNLHDMRASLVSADALRSFAVVAIGCLLLFLFVKGKLSRNLTIACVAALCLADMWMVNKRYLHDDQFVNADIRTTSFTKTPTDELILQDKTPDFRVLNMATNTFNENNTSYWHKSVGGYHAAKMQRYQELIEYYIAPQMKEAVTQLVAHGGRTDSLAADKFEVLNMLNTRYFIVPTNAEGGTAPILNPHAYGNAWFVDSVLYVADANKEIEALGQVSPRHTAVVDNRFAEQLHKVQSPKADNAAITLQSYAPNQLVYQTQNAADGVAVFSEIYYPQGWQVSIDGQKAQLARADYVLRALYVPAGQHTIRMTFNPRSVAVTEAIAYVALALMLLALLCLLFRAFKKQKAENEVTNDPKKIEAHE